jgi:hypothetical protein
MRAMSARGRQVGILLVLLGVVACVSYLQVWLAVGSPLDRTSDFAGSYVAAQIWRSGHPELIYDVNTEQATLIADGAPADHAYIPFENPPMAVLPALPTTLVDGGSAWRIWSTAQVAMLVLALLLTVRGAPWPERAGWVKAGAVAVAAAGTGGALLLLEGQWDGFSVLGLGAAYLLWKRDHRLAAGLALGLSAGIAKPHLVLGVGLFVLARRDWRTVAGGLLAVVVLLGLSLVVAGPDGLVAYAHQLSRPIDSPIRQMLSWSGLVGSWLGVGSGSYLLIGGLSLITWAGAAVAGWRTRSRPDLYEPALATAVVLSLLAAPHLLVHDLTLLAPPLVWLLGWRASSHPRTWPDAVSAALIGGWVLLSLLARVDLGQDTAAPPGRLVPWVLIAASAGGLWAVLRDPRTEKEPPGLAAEGL